MLGQSLQTMAVLNLAVINSEFGTRMRNQCLLCCYLTAGIISGLTIEVTTGC
jgi:hypothetical protein